MWSDHTSSGTQPGKDKKNTPYHQKVFTDRLNKVLRRLVFKMNSIRPTGK